MNLTFSPYAYARTAVMRSRVLKKADYDRLFKMGFNEIIKFLEESEYKKEIDEFDISSREFTVIEAALNANLMRTFKKLYRISNDSMREVISIYLLRYDMENLKIILRSKFANVPVEKIKRQFYESVNYSEEFFVNMSKKETISEIINTFSSLRQLNLTTDNLFELENQLDKYHLGRLWEFSQKLTGHGKNVANFLLQELEIKNVKTILRLQKENVSEIQKYLIHPSKKVLELLKKSSMEDTINYLRKVKLTTLENNSKMAELEIDLETSHLQKNSLLVHQDMLSASFILSYLFMKENEVRNLKMIIKARKLELPNEEIEKLVVIKK